MSKECCGTKIETPYCPICGKKNDICGPAHRLLRRTMNQHSVSRKQVERYTKYVNKEDDNPKLKLWLDRANKKFAELSEELDWIKSKME